MVKSQAENLSEQERDLIDTIRELVFGELYGVEIPDREAVYTRLLTPIEQDLILYIRSGCQHIDILTVHNGQPAMAETDSKIRGFRARRRVRFPTT